MVVPVMTTGLPPFQPKPLQTPTRPSRPCHHPSRQCILRSVSITQGSSLHTRYASPDAVTYSVNTSSNDGALTGLKSSEQWHPSSIFPPAMGEPSTWTAPYDDTSNQPLNIAPYTELPSTTLTSPPSAFPGGETRRERADDRYDRDGLHWRGHSFRSAYQTDEGASELPQDPMLSLAADTGENAPPTTTGSAPTMYHSGYGATGSRSAADRGDSRLDQDVAESYQKSYRRRWQ